MLLQIYFIVSFPLKNALVNELPNIYSVNSIRSSSSTPHFSNKQSSQLELHHLITRCVLISKVLEILRLQNGGGSVDERVKKHLLGVKQTLVDNHLHLLLCVVNLRKQRQMALLHAQNGLQQRIISEAERTALVLQILHLSIPTCSYACQLLHIHSRIKSGNHHPQTGVGSVVRLLRLHHTPSQMLPSRRGSSWGDPKSGHST